MTKTLEDMPCFLNKQQKRAEVEEDCLHWQSIKTQRAKGNNEALQVVDICFSEHDGRGDNVRVRLDLTEQNVFIDCQDERS